jgi:hypothetical protein
MIAVLSGTFVYSQESCPLEGCTQEGTLIEGQPPATPPFAPEIPLFATPIPTMPALIDPEGAIYEDGGQIVTRQPAMDDANNPNVPGCGLGNIVRNGNFSALPTQTEPIPFWYPFGTPSMSNITYQLTNGQLRFRRNGGDSAGLLQNINCIMGEYYSFTVSFRLKTNNMNLLAPPQRLTVIAHNQNFSDQKACTFWVGNNLETYSMTSYSEKIWNASLSFYAATGEEFVLDDVSMVVDIAQNRGLTDTHCFSPTTAAPVSGTNSTNLLTNGDFQAGLSPWNVYYSANTNPPSGDHNITDGVLQFRNNASVPSSSVVLEQTAFTSVPANTPLELRLQLNTSYERKRVTVILRNQWQDLRYCSFYVENTLVPTVVYMLTYPTADWGSVSVSIYDSMPTPFSYIRVDNVSLKSRPSYSLYMQQTTTADTICRQYDMLDYSLFYQGYGRDQLETIMTSVTMVGEEVRDFMGVGFDPNNRTHTDPRAAFQLVFGTSINAYIKFTQRSNNNFTCTVTYNAIREIVCDTNLNGTNLPKTEYVFVHMLGYLFNARSAQPGHIVNPTSLEGYINNTRNTNNQIVDDNGFVIMGAIEPCNSTWLRGERGWGSGPGSTYNQGINAYCTPVAKLFSNLQQNPMPYSSISDGNSGAAADMFLNWVYSGWYSRNERRGFLDQSWSPLTGCNQNPAGCPDSSRPGFNRAVWMNGVMELIFNAQNWD